MSRFGWIFALAGANLRSAAEGPWSFIALAGFMAANNFIWFALWWLFFGVAGDLRGWTLSDVAALYGIVAVAFIREVANTDRNACRCAKRLAMEAPRDLLAAGAFEDAVASMLIHPSPRDLADPQLLAAQGITVTFTGKTAHAAATPEQGINALDAFVQAYNNISTLRQQFEPTDRVHGVIHEGGAAPNVIPDRTVSQWIVRAATAERFDILRSRVLTCFQAAATATGPAPGCNHSEPAGPGALTSPRAIAAPRPNVARRVVF